MNLLIVPRRRVTVIGVVMLSIGLTGCLGDGNGSVDTPTTIIIPPAPVTTVLTGAAVKGPISGQACAYSLSSTGSIGQTALGCATTNATTGAYSISFSGFTGNVLVKAFGTYKDEATGQTKTIAESEAIRAMVACATAGVACKAAITPLTEAALRSVAAGGLTTANVEAAYLKVAQAYGLNPANTADAVSKLVATIPDFTSRTDAAATKYADILAVASQAQATYCGTSAACTLESYLAAVNTLLGGTSAVTSLQSALAAAFSAWSSNPFNTAGITCSLSSGAASCSLPSGATSGTVPAAPTGVTATATSATQINVNWTNVAGATGYNIYRSTSPNVQVVVGNKITAPNALPTQGPFLNTGLSAATAYYYKVTALNMRGESDGLIEVTATTSAAGGGDVVGCTGAVATFFATRTSYTYTAAKTGSSANVAGFVDKTDYKVTFNPNCTITLGTNSSPSAPIIVLTYRNNTYDANGFGLTGAGVSSATYDLYFTGSSLIYIMDKNGNGMNFFGP